MAKSKEKLARGKKVKAEKVMAASSSAVVEKGVGSMDAEVLESYLPLVNTIASIVASKGLPPNVQFEDLVSDGSIGLMKAWENFDANRGVKFETYASYRIRGEILDGLKMYNPVPYRVQVMVRDFAKRQERVILEEPPKKGEGISNEDFEKELGGLHKVVSASALMYLLSLESIEGEVDVPGGADPVRTLEFSELRQKLRDSIAELSDQEQKVIQLFYEEDYNQKEIAEMLKLSKSKVHRIHGRVLNRLKAKLQTHV